jgi:hypothetical protein
VLGDPPKSPGRSRAWETHSKKLLGYCDFLEWCRRRRRYDAIPGIILRNIKVRDIDDYATQAAPEKDTGATQAALP